MNYRLSKDFDLQLKGSDKIFFINFFQSSLELTKKIFIEYDNATVRIELRTNDKFSHTFNSIEDFKNDFYTSSEITSCEFTLLLYRTSNINSIDICVSFSFESNSLETIRFKRLSVSTLSQASTSDCILEIEKQLPSLVNIEEEVATPIPVEITTSSNERTYQETLSTLDQHVTLKHTILITVISCILTFIFGYILALLT